MTESSNLAQIIQSWCLNNSLHLRCYTFKLYCQNIHLLEDKKNKAVKNKGNTTIYQHITIIFIIQFIKYYIEASLFRKSLFKELCLYLQN